ncbi:MAG: hypothetical protein ABJ370_12870 [Paracoccaceae bacterium]
MKTLTFFAAVMLAILIGPIQASAQQTTTLGNLVSQCIGETRAPGAYKLVGKRKLQVQPGTGGTEVGARNVNDCLLDKRGVQFDGSKRGEVVAANSLIPARECKRDRNGRIIVGLVLTAGVVAASGDGAIFGGIAGSTVGIRRVNRDYRECLALAGQVNGSPYARGSKAHPAIPVAGCRKDSGVMQGGSSLCVGY